MSKNAYANGTLAFSLPDPIGVMGLLLLPEPQPEKKGWKWQPRVSRVTGSAGLRRFHMEAKILNHVNQLKKFQLH